MIFVQLFSVLKINVHVSIVRFAHGTRYATDCVRRLLLTLSRAVSIMNVCAHVFVCVCRLVANVTNLIPSCDDRTSHGRRSRGLVGSPSLVCIWSSIKTREVHVPSSAGSSGRHAS